MDKRKTAPVGVFDSGVGGLTVAREIMRQLPDENIVYFGDTARVPDGSKSKENIIPVSYTHLITISPVWIWSFWRNTMRELSL